MTAPPQQAFRFEAAPKEAPPPARRNLVIDAGAGTGKTTAIVAEVLKLLLGNEDLPPERIVLMTFTEKAAGEIADRIHHALTEIDIALDRGTSVAWPIDSAHPLLIVPLSARAACARQLARIESLRSQTIHSFCQMLLRQFPIEANLDPQFKIIQGFERSLLYGELYDAWIDEETRAHPNDAARAEWEVLLEHVGYLFLVRDLVFDLIERRDLLLDPSYDIGSMAVIERQLLDAIATIQVLGGHTPMARYFRAQEPPRDDLDAWVEYLKPVAAEVRATDLPRGRQHDAMSAALKFLRGTEKKGDCVVDRLASHRAAVALLSLTRRFIAFLDVEKRKRGVVDFDDLLIRTLAVLDDPAVLDRARRQFDYIFVDEFQDTDRVQARIIDRLARDARGALIDGRIVVVGDPKQSIYGFRRADPEMYDDFTLKLIGAGAEHRVLADQYRSDPRLLDEVNDLFARVFDPVAPDPNVFSPPYHPLRASRAREGQAGFSILETTCAERGDRHVAEAEAIADWIAERRDGSEDDLRPFALLLRRTTKLDDYIDVLERRGIRCILPPTRLFLDRPAAVDLIAVLRAIAYPFDKGAEASAARSPYFALTDLEIAGAGPLWDAFRQSLQGFRDAARHLTVAGVMDLVVDTCGIEAVYQAAADRDRALRHLEHLRAIAFAFDHSTGGSLRQFVDEIGRRREGEPDEMEPSLLDDNGNGVRILTVHAAKGLEFETVILPDLDFPRKPQELFAVEQERMLVVTGQVSTLSSYAAKDIAKWREEAEIRRLFYVAVTRAKREVVFVRSSHAMDAGFARYVDEHLAGRASARAASLTGNLPGRYRRRLADPALEEQLASSPIVDCTVPQPAAVPLLTRSAAIVERASSRRRGAGILLHRFLERWDGRGEGAELLAALAREQGVDDETRELVRRRVATVARSETFRRIAAAETAGRELPIAFLDANGDVVERRIDRLIRIDGQDVVVDYKSGAPDETRVARDRDQVAAYCRTVAAMNGRPCSGMLWYIDVDVDRVERVASSE